MFLCSINAPDHSEKQALMTTTRAIFTLARDMERTVGGQTEHLRSRTPTTTKQAGGNTDPPVRGKKKEHRTRLQ